MNGSARPGPSRRLHNSVVVLAAALMGLLACSSGGADPTGDAGEDSATDATPSDAQEVADSQAQDVADSQVPDVIVTGSLGHSWFVDGVWAPQWEEAIAATSDGWAVLLGLGPSAVTTVEDGATRELAPDGANNRLVLLPVAMDGRPSAVVEVATAPGAPYGKLRRCGDHVWGGATALGGSWLFRARADDLSDLAVARFEPVGEPGTGETDPGVVAHVDDATCVGSHAVFVVRVTQGMRVFPPQAEPIDLAPVSGETWLLADGRALLDEGRFDAVGERDVFITNVRAGDNGTVLYAALAVNADVAATSSRILRHDFATGATTPFVDVVFPSEVHNLRYAEAVGGVQAVGGVCGRFGGELVLGGIVLSNPHASDFCAIVVDGTPTAALAFEGMIPHDVAFEDGLFWLSGSLGEADAVIGQPVGLHDAFLVGFDPSDMSVSARAQFGAPNTRTGGRALVRVAGEGGCAAHPPMAVEVETVPVDASSFVADPDRHVRVVQAGVEGPGCIDSVATVVWPTVDFVSRPLVSAARSGSCATTRRLALLPYGTGVVVGSQTSSAVLGRSHFSLVAFGPETCSMTPQPHD